RDGYLPRGSWAATEQARPERRSSPGLDVLDEVQRGQILLARVGVGLAIGCHRECAYGRACGVGRREFLPERCAAAFDVDLLDPCRELAHSEDVEVPAVSGPLNGHEEAGKPRNGTRSASVDGAEHYLV